MKFCHHLGLKAFVVAAAAAAAAAASTSTAVLADVETTKATTTTTTTTTTYYTPTRIAFDDLVVVDDDDDDENNGISPSSSDLLLKELREVGMVSITGIPGFRDLKQEVFQRMESCMMKEEGAVEEDEAQQLVPEFRLDDDGRTHRRTIATRTNAGGLPEDIFVGMPEGFLVEQQQQQQESSSSSLVSSQQSQSCREFRDYSVPFRKTIQKVSDAFASRMLQLVGGGGNQEEQLTLMVDGNGEEYNIERVIKDGEHLEHFHSYFTPTTAAATNTDTSKTIDWHVDQGMMLIFTPGQRTANGNNNKAATNGFFIRDQNGSVREVSFDAALDDVVIMLGDGINQYYNNHKQVVAEASSSSLRAVPHALKLLPDDDGNVVSNKPRLWYGRMVLPPKNAYHPDYDRTYTFGEIRSASMMASNRKKNKSNNEDGRDDIMNIGCSSSSYPSFSPSDVVDDKTMMVLTNVGRRSTRRRKLGDDDDDDDDTTCDPETELYCWMSCMLYNESDVSPSICEEQGKAPTCMNDDGEVWVPGPEAHDNTMYIQCGDASSPVAANDTNTTTTGDGGELPEESTPETTADDGDKDDESSTTISSSLSLSTMIVAGIAGLFTIIFFLN